MSDDPNILRPRPRRPNFEFPPSSESSAAPTPAEPANPDLLAPTQDAGSNSTSVSRTGSIMNLTSSTLFGIYSPTAFDGSARDDNSPWGTEVQTPVSEHPPKIMTEPESPDQFALRRSRTARLSHGLFRGVILPQALKSALLLGFGIVYGVITIHLHENHWITPVKLEHPNYNGSWQYLAFWGVAGIALGNLLPWLDSFSEEKRPRSSTAKRSNSEQETEERTLSWVAVVRSVGAFVGIAFAMRRLPWQSTTQASLTLALANPVLWYLIDRTKTGFFLSTIVGLVGTSIALTLKPEMVPGPSDVSSTISVLNGTLLEDYGLATGITQEGVAVRTWMASVLFCACVCFGNIGRQFSIGSARREALKTS